MQFPEHQIKAFLDAAPDAMVTVDEQGTIALVNTQAETLFGYSRAELIGQPVELLLPERLRNHHAAHRASYFRAARPRPMGAGLELFGLRKDGSEFPAEISLSPVATDRGLFISSAIRDISDRKAVEGELLRARQAAEEANRAKSAFLAAASHDLRQPLQTLRLLGGVLTRVVAADSKAADAVASQAQVLRSMTDMLNSLLDISKLDAGVVKPDIGDCRVQDIFNRLRAEFAELAAAKGLELIVDDCGAVVRSDPKLLQQIIQNLVANSIRYTKAGWVRLRCFSMIDASRIEVLDSGIGIPVDQLQFIFEEFYQAPRAPGQVREGLGLGLSIVRRLVNLLGLTVEVESTVGVGSRFSLQVPPGEASTLSQNATPGRARNAPSEARLVLVVDDDTAVAAASAMLLRAEGFEVAVATGLSQARRELGQHARAPDLLLCDYHLDGGENGVEAIHAVRESAGRAVPAILVSGDTSSAMRMAMQGVEHCHLLSKPVDVEEMLGLVAQLVR